MRCDLGVKGIAKCRELFRITSVANRSLEFRLIGEIRNIERRKFATGAKVGTMWRAFSLTKAAQ